MAEHARRCPGCGSAIESVDDLSTVEGTVRRSWRCRVCHTPVSPVVAERLAHED